MKNIGTTLRSSLLLAVGLFGLAGCNADKSSMQSFFQPNDEHRRINQFIDKQTDLGVQQDATLQAYHFDGKHLNSLGLEKLDRLVTDEPGTEVVVYLNVGENNLTTARKDDVVAYLGELGIESNLIKIEAGTNPNSTSPAATGLSQLAKTDASASAGDSGMTAKSPMK